MWGAVPFSMQSTCIFDDIYVQGHEMIGQISGAGVISYNFICKDRKTLGISEDPPRPSSHKLKLADIIKSYRYIDQSGKETTNDQLNMEIERPTNSLNITIVQASVRRDAIALDLYEPLASGKIEFECEGDISKYYGVIIIEVIGLNGTVLASEYLQILQGNTTQKISMDINVHTECEPAQQINIRYGYGFSGGDKVKIKNPEYTVHDGKDLKYKPKKGTINLGGEIRGAPLIADINNDCRPDIIVTSSIDTGSIFAFDSELKPLKGWPIKIGKYIDSSPAVADIDDNGSNEIVIGSDNGKVSVIGSNGSVMWEYKLCDWITSSPAVSDIDGDGTKEIIIAGFGGAYKGAASYVVALNNQGVPLPGWPIKLEAGRVDSSPALFDIDKDGRKEIIFGDDDGFLHVFRTDGQELPGWPFKAGAAIDSSPAVADIDGDGNVEIIFGSDDRKLYCVGMDGKAKTGWPIFNGRNNDASPAIADLNGDGIKDVIFGVQKDADSGVMYSPAAADIDNDGRYEYIIPHGSEVVAVDHLGNVRMQWKLCNSTNASPVVADIDGDTELEMVIGDKSNLLHVLSVPGSKVPRYFDPWPKFRHDNDNTGDISAPFSIYRKRCRECYCWEIDPLLEQNYPNPVSNSGTMIAYLIQSSYKGQTYTINIYDALGRKIKELKRAVADDKQVYQDYWDGTDDKGLPVVSGVYYYDLQIGVSKATKKMVVVR